MAITYGSAKIALGAAADDVVFMPPNSIAATLEA
jgi:hypothetical protein